MSLGELRREARDWLGSESHLSGEVVRLPGNRLAVSFRTTGGQSGRVEGPNSEPDKLLDLAALAMFKATQPYRYAVYQSRRGNESEAVAALQELARSDVLHERLWAMHGLALSAMTQAETVAIYNRVLALKPDFLPAIGNMPIYAQQEGREEEAYRLSQRSAAAYAKGAADYTPSYANGFGLDARSRLAAMKDDLGEAARHAAAAERTQGGGPTFRASRPFLTAEAYGTAHDFVRARAVLAAAGFLDPVRRAAAEKIAGAQLDLAGIHAVATGDNAGLVAAFERMLAALQVQNLSQVSLHEASDTAEEVARIRGSMAIPLARLGRTGEAQAAIAGQPVEHDQLMRTRALIAAHAGDARTSDAMFARAAARTPSLPGANLLWTEALLHRRDFAGAERQAREAIRRGPNSAAAQRVLGEALLGQRKWAEAERAYATAARLAPQWGSLQMRWASALWRLGKRDEARAKPRAAATMALNDGDRRHLTRMWAKATT